MCPKWTAISETLQNIDDLIKDLVQTHQKSAEFENVEIAKLYHAAAFTMTELEKCKDLKFYFSYTYYDFYYFSVKLRFTLTSEELKDHAIQIEEVKSFVLLGSHTNLCRTVSKSIKKN